jgi:hypothetical protein
MRLTLENNGIANLLALNLDPALRHKIEERLINRAGSRMAAERGERRGNGERRGKCLS